LTCKFQRFRGKPDHQSIGDVEPRRFHLRELCAVVPTLPLWLALSHMINRRTALLITVP
jgi:hypothetical protein